jgi:uncharacterized Zn finger protein
MSKRTNSKTEPFTVYKSIEKDLTFRVGSIIDIDGEKRKISNIKSIKFFSEQYIEVKGMSKPFKKLEADNG